MAKKRRSSRGFSVARTTYSSASGATRETAKYYARFKDHAGTWHRIPAFSDYDASLELARKLRRLAELRAAGEGTRVGWFGAIEKAVFQQIERVREA